MVGCSSIAGNCNVQNVCGRNSSRHTNTGEQIRWGLGDISCRNWQSFRSLYMHAMWFSWNKAYSAYSWQHPSDVFFVLWEADCIHIHACRAICKDAKAVQHSQLCNNRWWIALSTAHTAAMFKLQGLDWNKLQIVYYDPTKIIKCGVCRSLWFRVVYTSMNIDVVHVLGSSTTVVMMTWSDNVCAHSRLIRKVPCCQRPECTYVRKRCHERLKRFKSRYNDRASHPKASPLNVFLVHASGIP